MKEQGYSVRDIARELGVGNATVQRALKRPNGSAHAEP
ncbi:MAG: helix-turn-helix domain-containing protein [Terricaulis sp.]|nr:helix-turn-helix domain-containing protein [Terricaulis sp.]